MSLEATAFGAVLLAALVVIGFGSNRRGRRALPTLVLPGVVLVAWFVLTYQPPATGETTVVGRPIQLPQDGFVSSDTCRSCHPSQYATWHASYHRTMTQVASPASIVGTFEGQELRLGDFTYRPYRAGGDFMVDIEVPPGGHFVHEGATTRRVVMATGSHHYQVYWLETPNGRELEQFPLAYVIPEQRWVSRAATLIMPPAKFGGVRSGSWNRACIRCHTTNGRPRLGAHGAVDSQVGEFGIACEACHGPGAEHVELYRDPRGRYRAYREEPEDTRIVNPSELNSRRSSEVCGQCHGIFQMRRREDWEHWNRHGYRYRPGDEMAPLRHVVRHPGRPVADPAEQGYLDERFWRDGMIRVVGREYNALLDTPCFTDGDMSCLSCHTMHAPDDMARRLETWTADQLAAGMDGPAACLQCHETYGDPEAERAHTRHEPGTSGSDCLNCHMPYTTYGLLKASRSHTIDSPTVRASLATGRPNACNQCHLDRSLAWTSGWLARWYGTPPPVLPAEHRSIPASVHWALTGDAAQRALMAWSFGWEAAHGASEPAWMAPYLAQLLADPYDAVRLIAGRSIRNLPGFEGFEYDFGDESYRTREPVRRALAHWEALHPGAEPPDPEAVAELLARRDDRPVRLTE